MPHNIFLMVCHRCRVDSRPRECASIALSEPGCPAIRCRSNVVEDWDPFGKPQRHRSGSNSHHRRTTAPYPGDVVSHRKFDVYRDYLPCEARPSCCFSGRHGSVAQILVFWMVYTAKTQLYLGSLSTSPSWHRMRSASSALPVGE